MFLNQLYKHSKLFFLLVIVFIGGQLFINVKHGLVFSPFYHYGMYSHVMKPVGEYRVLEIYVDGTRLMGGDFTPWTWDKILQPVNYFTSIPQSNALYHNEVKRLTPSFLLGNKTENFLQKCDSISFTRWYKAYLSQVIGKTINSVEVTFRNYQFTDGRLEPTNTTFTLSGLCQ